MPAYAETIVSPSSEHSKDERIMSGVAPNDTDVVVSGMSGRFPESSSVSEFCKNLYGGVDMISDDERRWPSGINGLPKRSGKLIDLKKFDASYFSVSPRQAHSMDPQLRILLEVTHEALFDAGIHPNDIRGRNIGVYVGVSLSETEDYFTRFPDSIDGYELTGCCRAMFANRISFTLDLKGPSFAIDTACSSSLVAMKNAWTAIKSGEIEGAIVAGCNLTLRPQTAMEFNALSMLSVDGSCKSFDAAANGYVRSEAITAIFLQRKKDSRRIYAHVVEAGMNTDGFKSKGITFPSGDMQKRLLQEVYMKAGVSPSSVSYVEAHGTGTKAGDPQEVNAIADVLCNDRNKPLLMGSVKSNMGHSEAASGLCSIVKVLLSMQNKEIPGNLHFTEPNPEIPSLLDGRIKVINKNTSWKGNYAAVNSFGFGGANVHILLKRPEDAVRHFIPQNTLSKRLILSSGRSEKAVEHLLNAVDAASDEYLPAMLDPLSATSSILHPYRGFLVKDSKDTDSSSTVKVFPCLPSKPPVWLVFTGMGSQWTGCGKHLMEIPVFAKTIDRCRSALLPHGIDIVDVITRIEPNPMNSSTNSFTAIAAVQVGLVEVLRSIGLNDFDGCLGHSVGELGCAYADGTLTPEQTVLTAYWRGRAVEEADLPAGAMAAVGLSGEKANKLCGDGPIVVACYNSKDSVTISGPETEVKELENELIAKDIFCRSVNSGGVAFHHSSLKKAAPRLLSELEKIIIRPNKRTSRWVSTSVPEERWNTDLSKLASPEYFVNNLVSPVLFAQGLTKIPEEATVIEISPHALLQAVIRRGTTRPTLVPLVRKETKNLLDHFLQAIGKLYTTGVNIDVSSLYGSQFRSPVPGDTPSLASLLLWDHEIEWDVATFGGATTTSQFNIEVDISSNENSYIEGHTIDGRILFPATGYLMLVWKALSKLLGTDLEQTPVIFEDIAIHQATVFSASNSNIKFSVRILLATGEFEVLAGESVAVSGKIHEGVKPTPERKILRQILVKESEKQIKNQYILDKNEVYKELKLRGYEYKGVFQGIENANIEGSKSVLNWESNWVSFLDTMLQASLLGSTSRGLQLPTRIRKILIEPNVFMQSLQENEKRQSYVEVWHSRNLNVTACSGIEIYGLKATMAPRRAIQDEPLLESYQFTPKFINEKQRYLISSEWDATRRIVDLVIENCLTSKLKVLNLLNQSSGNSEEGHNSSLNLSLDISKVLKHYPQIQLHYSLFSTKNFTEDQKRLSEEIDVKFLSNIEDSELSKQNLIILSDSTMDEEFISKLDESTFVLSNSLSVQNSLLNAGFVSISSIPFYNLYLLRKPRNDFHHSVLYVNNDGAFSWIEELKEKMAENKETLWLVSKEEPFSGILGMFNCLRRELGGQNLRCFISDTNNHEEDEETWNHLLTCDLAVNIQSSGVLGTMRHMELKSTYEEYTKHSYLNVLTRGDLSSLTWLRGQKPEEYNSKNTLLSTVHYAPLNFRDIMLASGKLPPDALPGGLAHKDCILGLEFAGVCEDGSRVMGLVPAGGLATTIRSDPLLTWKIPSSWSMEEASSVPVVYSTAYYALVVRGGLKRGESILIHAGSGGVGQAAISIALSRNCRVFTTVSSEKKRNFLKERFPQLTNDNFASSRDASFEYDVLERTDGEGVDLVLNSLAGELLQASVRCLKEHGRFLEIGKADLANNTALGMSIFLKNVTFHGILLDALFDGMIEERRRLQELLYEGMIIGEVIPLPVTSYSWDMAEEAFRFMASGKHIGKVVLDIVSQNLSKNNDVTCHTVQSSIPSVYRFWPRNNFVYIITGGLGGLGLELCEWLLLRGAKKIVLTSRRGIVNGYQALCMKRWAANGADVVISKQDASTFDGAEKLIQQASIAGPIGGIFHLAMILDDSLLENQTIEKFQRVCEVKANGAIALDSVSRKLCPELHAWVTFSSVTCGRGNAGQSNYGWANSVSEKVVEKRVADGLPGVAIQWGGIGDVGVLASTLGNVEVGGTRPQSVRSVIACMDHLLASGSPVVSSICLATGKSVKDSKGNKSLMASVANILGVRDITKAPKNVSLGDLGLDSLMSVEIKQTLEREADIVLTPEAIRNLTFAGLKEIENSSSGKNITPGQAKSSDVAKEKGFSWINYPLIAEKSVVVLNEKIENGLSPLFILAPMQGTSEVLAEMAAHVNRKVCGLQYMPNYPSNDISAMADCILKEIEMIQPEGDICLAGYSFGAFMAVEIAHRFQTKRRKISSLILLDGSYSYVQNVILALYDQRFDLKNMKKDNLSQKDLQEFEFQTQIESYLMYVQQLVPVDASQLRKEWSELKSAEDVLLRMSDVVLNTLGEEKVKSLKLEPRIVEEAATLFHKRLAAAYDHELSPLQLDARTMLIKAQANSHKEKLSSDYGLSEVIKESPKVAEVSGNHESFISADSAAEVAALINDFTK